MRLWNNVQTDDNCVAIDSSEEETCAAMLGDALPRLQLPVKGCVLTFSSMHTTAG